MTVRVKQCGCSEMHVRNGRVKWTLPETWDVIFRPFAWGTFSPIRLNSINYQLWKRDHNAQDGFWEQKLPRPTRALSIRTPRPPCANQDAWVVITPKRPKANSIHITVLHAWTRTPHRNTVQKAVFSLTNLSASLIRLWPSCYFDFGYREMVGSCSKNKPILSNPMTPCSGQGWTGMSWTYFSAFSGTRAAYYH